MKSFLTLVICLCLFAAIQAKDKYSNIQPQQAKEVTSTVPPIEDTDLFFESWETGDFHGWTPLDETALAPQWHLDTWMAYGGSGESWWMADVTLGIEGGYNNNWYQVLDSDEIILSGSNQQLSFYHRYSVEPPSTYLAYDAWDGMNLRISTDGGSNWDVLTNPIPAYSNNSLYSFGDIHGEGPNIPGWTGALTTWTQVTVDLTAYSGQTVKIRFAFASDGVFATGVDGGPEDMFAWQIDDIEVTNDGGTIFSNNGVVSGMTALNNVPSGADLWSINMGTGATGSYFADCNNGSGTYVPNMRNSLTSPYFNLPSIITEAYLDFSIRGGFLDNQTYPDPVDYWGAYVQVEGETGRRYISNITQDPNGDNYIYTDAPLDWSLFSASYSTGIVDLSSLIGNNVRFIIEFESDEDAPIGEAIQVDDVHIWTPQVVPVELTSFTAMQVGTSIKLEWNTATELNNRGFEIERKVINNGVETDWQMVAFKKGHGTMQEPTSYTYEDEIVGIEADQFMYRLKQLDFNGRFEYSDIVEVANLTPVKFELAQNYPNPFNPVTKISYGIPSDNFVSLKIYNVTGQLVSTLVNELKSAGSYNVDFDASQLTSGVYFYILRAGNNESSSNIIQTKKMMLLK
jgi:hypothetical protein